MSQAIVTLPDGRKARVTFDTPEQLDATISDLTGEADKEADRKAALRMPETPLHAAGDVITRVVGGIAGSAAGGVAGLARGAGAGAASLAQGEGFRKAGEAFTDEATRTIEDVGGAVERGTRPRTEMGAAATRAVEAPFRWLGKQADVAGEAVSRATGSPALGSLTNVAVQSAPAVVGGAAGAGLRGLRGRVGASSLEAAEAPPRTAPSTVGEADVPRGTPAPTQPVAAPEAPGAAPAQPAPPTRGMPEAAQGRPVNPYEQRAEAYARSIGLDWARLGAGTRKALTTIAQDSQALGRLDPAAVKRQALLQSQRVPIPATRGQLTRDPVELRREAIASRTDEGAPIRETDVEANRALQANLEVLRGRVAGKRGGMHDPTEEGAEAQGPSIREPTKVPSQVGASVTKAAAEKAKWSRKGYDALYKIAREKEPTAEAGLKPVTDLLTENPDIQHLGWVQGWLSKARAARAAKTGESAADVTLDRVTLNELDDLRKLSQKHGQGTDAHYAAELRKAVDTAMEDVPEGAKAWKAARDAFQKHQREFKDQTAVRGLVSTKKGTSDPAIAAEKVWGKIKSGSVEQIRQIKQTLLTGGTAATRMAGKRAWRDIRGETVNRILEDARNVVASDETERSILTAAALRKSLNSIPRENLEEILGKATVRELYDLLRASKITRTQPSARVTESGTVPNALLMAEKVLSHIPGGKLAIGGAKAVKALRERGGAAVAARRATQDPLAEKAGQVAGSRAARRQALSDLEAGGPTLPGAAPEPTIGQVIPPKKP